MTFDSRDKGFSLIEVVLAIGIFLVTVLVLVGMLGPTLESVEEVDKTDEIVSVIDSVSAFLNGGSDFGQNVASFDIIYETILTGGYSTIYVYRSYLSANSSDVKLSVGFSPSERTSTQRISTRSRAFDFKNAAGRIYRCVLTVKPLLPREYYKDRGRRAFPRYLLTNKISEFNEGYLPIEVAIYAENPGPSFSDRISIRDLSLKEPDYVFNTAISR